MVRSSDASVGGTVVSKPAARQERYLSRRSYGARRRPSPPRAASRKVRRRRLLAAPLPSSVSAGRGPRSGGGGPSTARVARATRRRGVDVSTVIGAGRMARRRLLASRSGGRGDPSARVDRRPPTATARGKCNPETVRDAPATVGSPRDRARVRARRRAAADAHIATVLGRRSRPSEGVTLDGASRRPAWPSRDRTNLSIRAPDPDLRARRRGLLVRRSARPSDGIRRSRRTPQPVKSAPTTAARRCRQRASGRCGPSRSARCQIAPTSRRIDARSTSGASCSAPNCKHVFHLTQWLTRPP